jgi:hypothetical protein
MMQHRICYYRERNTQKNSLLICLSFNYYENADVFNYWLAAIVIYRELKTQTHPRQQIHPRHIHHLHSLSLRLVPCLKALHGLWYGKIYPAFFLLKDPIVIQ